VLPEERKHLADRVVEARADIDVEVAARHVHQALRLSHGIALTMLFVLGAAYGRITGQPAIRGALLMSGFGVVLAVMTLMLGG